MNDQEQHPPPPTPGPGSGANPPSGPQGHPGAPPPPPPPATPGGVPPAGGAPPPAAAPLPWEDRARIGFGPALVQTAQLLISRPREAFDRARRKGDYGSPLLWVVIIGILMGIVTWIYGMMFAAPLMALFPMEARREMGPLMALGIMGGGVFNIITRPIAAVIGVFVWSLVGHLCLLLIGGGSRSESGFEGTLRAAAYSQVAQLAGIVPIVGGLVAAVWTLVLLVIGMSSMHRLTTGTAVLVVLIPAFLVCVCLVMITLGALGMAGLANS